MGSNCLFWAVAMWWRLRKPNRLRQARERQFSWRMSRFGCFPHFGVMVACRDGRFRFISYKPFNPRHKLLPPPFFKGRPRFADWLDTVANWPKDPEASMAKFEIYEDAKREWRWRLKASNGRIVASGEGYKTQAGAVRGTEALQRAAKRAKVKVVQA